MSKKLHIKIILGSIRDGRFSEKIGPWVEKQVQKNTTCTYEVLDLREYPLPFFDQKETPSSKKKPYTNEVVAQWTEKIKEADAYIFVTPEYDRSIPGVLKNAVDWVYPEWNKKPAAFVGYGTVGGARAIEHLRMIAVELQMATVRQAVNVFAHWTLQDEKGDIQPGALDQFERGAQTMLDQLLWWAQALKTAREEA
ncbi:NAD(P)H-dependent oxidoreductase [Candidatus Kaiserbacteria bacterium]|nr:NAD(P)H-dependent oxidoreductase [Candidatus Kaiserbacteria bacterium]